MGSILGQSSTLSSTFTNLQYANFTLYISSSSAFSKSQDSQNLSQNINFTMPLSSTNISGNLSILNGNSSGGSYANSSDTDDGVYNSSNNSSSVNPFDSISANYFNDSDAAEAKDAQDGSSFGSKLLFASGSFVLYPGFANPLNFRGKGKCKIWLDPCSMRLQIKIGIVISDAFGAQAFPNQDLMGLAHNQSCSSRDSDSIYRKFPQYSADIPTNQISLSLFAPVRSNVSQLDFVFPPQNKPASIVVHHPDTNDAMFCCALQYSDYPICNRAQPVCPGPCVVAFIISISASFAVFSCCLSCYLRHSRSMQNLGLKGKSLQASNRSAAPVKFESGILRTVGSRTSKAEPPTTVRITAPAPSRLGRRERTDREGRGSESAELEGQGSDCASSPAGEGSPPLSPREEELERRIGELQVELQQTMLAPVRTSPFSWTPEGNETDPGGIVPFGGVGTGIDARSSPGRYSS